MVLAACEIGLVPPGAFHLDLGQFFPQQLQVSGKESMKDGVRVQVEPGFVGRLDLGWSTHGCGLPSWWGF